MDIQEYSERLGIIWGTLTEEWSKLSDETKAILSVGILAEMRKDERGAMIKEERAGKTSPQEQPPASDKQLKYLAYLQVKHKPNLTKQEASELIDKATK